MAFRHCTKLSDITIPPGVNQIGVGAFASCISLTSMTIPEDVSQIGIAVLNPAKTLPQSYYQST